MSKIKLPHASGNSMSIGAPATNPASDLEIKLPSTVGSANQILKNSSTPGTLEFGGVPSMLATSTSYEGLELQTPSGDGSGEFHIGVHQSGSSAGRTIVFSRGGSDGMDTESMRIQATGGISFNGDTAAANALDDYEEGTFTPAFGGTNATGTFGYAIQTGKYTRIGHRVWFTIVLQSNSHSGSTSGNFRITGLPLAVPSEAPVACTHFWITGFNPSGGAHGVSTQLNTNEQIEFYVIGQSAGDNYTDVTASNIALSNAYVKVDGSYQIDGA